MSLNPNTEHKISLFPLTESNCFFLNILTIFQSTLIKKQRESYLRGGQKKKKKKKKKERKEKEKMAAVT